jgi:hypothetical protein
MAGAFLGASTVPEVPYAPAKAPLQIGQMGRLGELGGYRVSENRFPSN